MFSTIVWASDGSRATEQALDWVARLASGERAMLWVVHVALPGEGATEVEEAVIAKLKARVHDLREHGCAVSLYVVRGARAPVGTAIDIAARAVDADLVVLGAGRRPSAGMPAPTGVALQVLAAASYPVLSLPPAVSGTPAPAAAHP